MKNTITLVKYSKINNLEFSAILEFINNELGSGKSLFDFEELHSIESSSIAAYFKKKKYQLINNQYQLSPTIVQEETISRETSPANPKILKYFVSLLADQVISNQTEVYTTYSSVKLSRKNLSRVHQLTKGKMLTFSFIVNTLLDKIEEFIK